MGLQGVFVLLVIALMIYALIKEMLRPGLILFTVLIVFMAFGVITTGESLSGFSNKGMITVAVLFLVSEGVRQTGALNYLAKVTLPKKKGPIPKLLIQILVPVTALSAFLNNTPVVIIEFAAFKISYPSLLRNDLWRNVYTYRNIYKPCGSRTYA